MNNKIQCYGCGALVEAKEGQPHEYIGATRGCWDLYCQILEKQYGEYNYPQFTHRLTVDTYAIQHPGQPARKAIQSVNVHLVSLYLIFERGLNGQEATKKMGEILSKEPNFNWLEPPTPNGQLTVIDVLTSTSQEEHGKKVKEWAEDVWNCWYSKHEQTVEKLIIDNF